MLANRSELVWSKGRTHFLRHSVIVAAAATMGWFLGEPVVIVGFSLLVVFLFVAALRWPRIDLSGGSFVVVNARSFKTATFDVAEILRVERVESGTSSNLNAMVPPKMRLPHVVRFHLVDGRRIDYHDGAANMTEHEVVQAIKRRLEARSVGAKRNTLSTFRQRDELSPDSNDD